MSRAATVALPPLSAGEPAPDVTLRGAEDQPVQLSDLWQAAPLVLFFERHFG